MSSTYERLDYIAEMVEGLKIMSVQAGFGTLASLLDMAHLEATERRRDNS